MSNLAASLETWSSLNQTLRSASEVICQKLLAIEKDGKRRVQFLLRIYGRYNRLRGDRERRELLSKKKG